MKWLFVFILALIIFLLIRAVNKMMPKADEAPATPAAEPADIALLREIRDALKNRPA